MFIDVVRWGIAAVILVVSMIGFLFLTRGTFVLRVRSVGTDAKPVAPSEPEFPVTVALLTGGILLAGNRVELALNGDGTFEGLWADLQSAERSITVQMYYAIAGRVAGRPLVRAAEWAANLITPIL